MLMKARLFLMLGYPGAGKTTTAEIVSKLTGAVHLSSDRFRLAMFPEPKFTPEEHQAVYGALDYLTELLLSKGVSVIYDANLNRYQHRHEKYLICHKTGAEATLLWVQADAELAKKRATIHGDNDDKRPYGNLAPDVFDRLVHEIEPPHTEEPRIDVDGTRVNEIYIRQLLQPAGVL